MLGMIFQTWQFIVVSLAGWLNRQQQDIVEYLREENRVLREQLKGRRIRSRMPNAGGWLPRARHWAVCSGPADRA